MRAFPEKLSLLMWSSLPDVLTSASRAMRCRLCAIQSLAQPCSLTPICLLCWGWCQSFLELQENYLPLRSWTTVWIHQYLQPADLGPSPALMCPQVPRNPVEMQSQIQDPEERLRFCIAHNLPHDSLLPVLRLHFN